MKSVKAPQPAEVVDLVQLAQTCALGGVVKDAQLGKAKKALPDSFSQEVDFTVRIHGIVTKGMSTPASSGTRPAKCDLANASMISQLMIDMGITPAKLKTAIRRVVKKFGPATDLCPNPANAAILNCFNEVSDEVAAELPPKTWTSPGTAGAVNTKVDFEIIKTG